MMSSGASNPLASGSCSGVCEYEFSGGEWFLVNSTCSDNCTCPSYKLPDGTIKKPVLGSNQPGEGLDHALFEHFLTKFKIRDIQQSLNLQPHQIPCVDPQQAPFDLS
jgi:hypothetical protein